MKIAFLTGSSGQLGLSIAECLSQNGWSVCGMDLNEEDSNSHLCFYKSSSVLSRDSFSDFFIQSIAYLNPDKVTHMCLINNAGVAVFSPSEERTIDEFNFVAQVNLLGPIYGMTEFKKFVSDGKFKSSLSNTFKSIVNIASIYGLLSPNPSIYTDTARNSSEVYGATKAGLIQMTKYFSVRYSKVPISINCIAPGGILNTSLQGPDFISNYSQLVPMERLCTSSELAKTCLFLADSNVEYLSGQTIALDGGMSSW